MYNQEIIFNVSIFNSCANNNLFTVFKETYLHNFNNRDEYSFSDLCKYMVEGKLKLLMFQDKGFIIFRYDSIEKCVFIEYIAVVQRLNGCGTFMLKNFFKEIKMLGIYMIQLECIKNLINYYMRFNGKVIDSNFPFYKIEIIL